MANKPKSPLSIALDAKGSRHVYSGDSIHWNPLEWYNEHYYEGKARYGLNARKAVR